MVSDPTLFQVVQKLMIVDSRAGRVLLCRRAGELDLDGVFTLVGGKLEHSDEDTVVGLRRERDEEIGSAVALNVLTKYTVNREFTRSDGKRQILLHYLCEYLGGEVILNDEYSEYQWVSSSSLENFSPIIDNIPEIVRDLERLAEVSVDDDYLRL